MSWKPPTCVVQLLFLFFTEHTRITEKYFPEGYSLHDIFLASEPTSSIPSDQRSQAFLWLVHRWLETPSAAHEDFADGDSKLPSEEQLVLGRSDCSNENIDSLQEIAFGSEMKKYRDAFVLKCKVEDALKPPNFADEILGDDEKKSSSRSTNTSARRNTSTKAGMHAHPSKLGAQYNGITGNTLYAAHLKRARSSASQDPSQKSPLLEASEVSASGPGHGQRVLNTNGIVSVTMQQAPRQDTYPLAMLVEDGLVSEPDLFAQWTEFTQLESGVDKSLLRLAWEKVKRDIDNNRDPVYESEDETDWTASELRPRTLGFTFTNYETGHRDTLQYEGPGPDFDPELLASHVDMANRLDTTSPVMTMSVDNGQGHLYHSEFTQALSDGNVARSSTEPADESQGPAEGQREGEGEGQGDGEDDELDDESADGDISVGLNSSGDTEFTRFLQDVQGAT